MTREQPGKRPRVGYITSARCDIWENGYLLRMPRDSRDFVPAGTQLCKNSGSHIASGSDQRNFHERFLWSDMSGLRLHRQIEDQDFRALTVLQFELACIRQLQSVSRLERDSVGGRLAAGNVYVQPTAVRDAERRVLSAVEQTGVYAGVLVNQHRALRGIG